MSAQVMPGQRVMLAVKPPPTSSEVGLGRGRERECPWVLCLNGWLDLTIHLPELRGTLVLNAESKLGD
jgi:hypothetical protein